MTALTEKQQATIAAYATSKTYAEANEQAKTNEMIATQSTFYFWINSVEGFKKEFDRCKKEYIAQKKDELAFKNMFLHEQLIDDLSRQAKKGNLTNKEKIELLKLTAREEFDKGKQALQKAERVVKRLTKQRGTGNERNITPR